MYGDDDDVDFKCRPHVRHSVSGKKHMYRCNRQDSVSTANDDTNVSQSTSRQED